MNPRRSLPLLAGLALGAVLSAGPREATAAPKGAKKPAPSAPSFDAKGVAEQIGSADPDKIAAGLKAARAAGKDAAKLAPLVERLLARGLPTGLAKLALEALGDIGTASSSPVLARWVHHREPELRRAAVTALLKTRGPAAVTALRSALSDSDARVRGVAASGLGALGAREALKDLSAALDRKVHEAAAAIGQLCRGEECDAFAGQLGRIPLDIMTSGFDQVLFRPADEVSDDQKIRLVGRLRELGTGEAHRYLKDVLSRWSGSAKVKGALEQAVQATAGSPGSNAPGGAP